MGEVRKLQKKLRQIENLELKASLTPEEAVKVSKKEELRSRLVELLQQLSVLQQIHCTVGKEEDKMKRQVDNATEHHTDHTPAVKLARDDQQEKEDKTKHRAEDQIKKRGSGGQSPKLPDPDAEFTSLKASWEKVKFRLRTLKGHSDIITCVAAVDNLVISGSRDTTLKVWHVPTATEQHNLGGHSGGVTCLSTPPAEYCRKLASAQHLSEKERFIISGSSDCCVRIWTLSSGQCVKSIYTFNAVASLCFIAEWEGCIVTGSDAGKLQVWDWLSQENCQSVNAHLDAVTTLQSQGPLVFSGSIDGMVYVWEVCDRAAEPLKQLKQWGSEVTGCSRVDEVTGRLRLSARGDHIFLANGRSSIRVLNWRTGTMRRLTNHSSIAGVTDCVHQVPCVLVGSCFDLTSGKNTLNLFSLPQCRYLVSLTSSDLSRILCFSAWLTPSGGHRWVTGGRDLTVWEQLPENIKKRGDVNVRRDSRLDGSHAESDGDSEEESKGDEPADMQLSAMPHATPTPLWAVDWGPTQPLEDETHHFLPSQEVEGVKQATPEVWPRRRNSQANQTQQHPLSIEAKESGEEPERDAEEREMEEVDPQFYVTVTISSVLILSALIISAKLCYDRNLSQRPPPLSLALPRALAQEDSRHTLQSTPSFPDRERLPVVNL